VATYSAASRGLVRTAATVTTVVVTLTVVSCTGSRSPASSPAPPVRIHLMEFNIEYGGSQVDFASVPAAIEAAGADVVAIEEGYAKMPKIAKALGWDYYDERTQVVSKYPLLAPAGGAPFTYVEVEPGGVIAIANEHLPSSNYGPFNVRDGMGRTRVLNIENGLRVPAVEPAIESLGPLATAGMPVFITGDFNTPSHLDWTAAAIAGQKDKRYPVDWPVSQVVEAAGFRDSYRQIFPDPVAHPGLTWPANRPIAGGYNPYRRGDTPDRIDFIYDGGPATPIESKIVGEGGVPGVDIVVSPWPTDHRAQVTTFDVAPAAPPVMLSMDRRLILTDADAVVRFHVPGSAGEHVVAVPRGGDATTDSVADAPITGTDGAVTLAPTGGWNAGVYDAVLVDASGQQLAEVPLWVEAPGQHPVVATGKAKYGVGDPIDVTWRWAPGNRWDWIAIYRRHRDPNTAPYLEYVYTKATIDGSATIDVTAHGKWPLEAGAYSVYLMQDDDYVKLAGGDFTIR
jgi:hypothetical protein